MKTSLKPLTWVPTLYFMQGLPFALVMLVSSIILKQFNFINSQITFITSLFIFPWVIKFIFAALFEQIQSKRNLTIMMQYGLTIITSTIAFFLYQQQLTIIIVLFFIMAWIASWHDIASDGLYLISLPRRDQINFIPVRTVAFQLARLFSQGGIVMIVGLLLTYFLLNQAWMSGFLILAITMLTITIFNQLVLPNTTNILLDKTDYSFMTVFKEFLTRPFIISFILFLFFYNVAEAQLIKVVPLFLLDSVSAGGLNLSAGQVGFIYGTLGMIAMLLGISISGWMIHRLGLKKTLVTVTIILMFSHISYILISSNNVQFKTWIIPIIVFTQLCYGLSNNAYMVFLLDSAREHRYSMSFYAISTGIMAFGMLLPGAVSGIIQHYLGYFRFFSWILILQILVVFFTIFITRRMYDEHSKPSDTI